MNIKLSCTANMVPGETLTEKAHILRRLGYDGIAVFVDEPDWSDELLEEMLLLEERTGVRPCEFVFTGPIYGHLMDKDLAISREAVTLYKRSIAVAGRLGAITEMEYEYRSQDPLPLFDPYRAMPEGEQRRFVGIVEELGAEVADGAWMLIEPCNRYETKYLTRLRDCQAMLERAAPEATRNMGLLADFFHMSLEETDLEQSVIDAGKWIRHVHLGDHNRLAPGYGRTDWHACMRGLKAIGFDGYMNLECGLPGSYDVILPEVADLLRRTAERA